MKRFFLSALGLLVSLNALGQNVSTMSGQYGTAPPPERKAPTNPTVGSEFECGLSCNLQQGYESALFQLEYVQKKSALLKDAWEKDTSHQSQLVSDEIKGFCTDAQFSDASGERSVCYRNSQLFMAASIQRYQDALKEIAENKARLTSGRAIDGSLAPDSSATVHSGFNAVPHSFHIPTVSELRQKIQEAYQKTGILNLQLTPDQMKKQWEELIYVGGDPKRSQVFEGRAAKIKEVDGRGSTSDDKKAQVYSRSADGSVEKVKALIDSDKKITSAYKDKVESSHGKFQGVDRDNLKAITKLPNGQPPSIAYDAFMHTRNGLAETFEGGVKKLDVGRTPTKTSKASAVTVDNGKGIQNANHENGSPYGKYGEEGQANVANKETSYSVTHGALDKNLSQDALEESEK